MVALPEPRPETPAQSKKREAIENVQRSLLGRQLLFDELTPAGQKARRASGVTALKGLAVGIPAGIAGLPADLFALIARDLPDIYHKLIRGEPLSEEEQGQFYRAADEIQKVAGTEAMAGYMGFEDELQDEDFQQGLMVGAFGADPALIATGAGKLLGRGARATADATRTTDLPGEMGPAAFDFTRPNSDPTTTELFQFDEEMFHRSTGTRIPQGSTVRGQFDEFVTAEGRDATGEFIGLPDAPSTSVPGLPEEPDIIGSASDIGPPRTIDTAIGPMTVSDTVPLPREEPTVDLSTLPRSEVTGLPVLRTEVTERMATPEETAAFIRGEDPSEFAPTDEGIATLPAAEDVIDVEPVAQAALTPIRTEGQQILREQAFPITEDADVFEPSGISELGPNYFGSADGRDFSDTLPGSGQRGIATTFDYGDTTPQQVRRQGNVADYSPSFQTIDRLPDRDYTKQQVIEFLEAQPEAAMRDLKGSGFIEYLRSPYAPETYDSVADIRKDYITHTPQLKVNTVTNGDIAEQQLKMQVGETVETEDLLPFSYANRPDESKIPYSGQQTFFEEGAGQEPFDRGVIILNNPNTSKIDGTTLRAPDGHNYFGGDRGVEGYIAHSRFAVVNGPTGKKIAVIEESQGNTVSDAARGRAESLTGLQKSRVTYLSRNPDFQDYSAMQRADRIMTNQNDRGRDALARKATGEDIDLSDYGMRIMDTAPDDDVYKIFFEAYQNDLRNAKGVFDIDADANSGLFTPYGVRVDSAITPDVLNRNATTAQKQKITDIFQNNQVISNRYTDLTNFGGEADEIATFDDMLDQDNMFRIINNMKELENSGDLDEAGQQFLSMFKYHGDRYNDLRDRIFIEGDATEKYMSKLRAKSKQRYDAARQQIVDEFGEQEFDEMLEAYEAVQDGEMVPGQPFATTRDFDEYMPRLILQELIRRGDIDEVVFPSPDALMSISGRAGFRTGPEAAGFRNTYGKGVKKGLNKIKAENPDFKLDTIENYTPGGNPTDDVTLFGSSTVINLRDPAVREIFEGRLIRRAKGGEVDLRPQKMIHSGIGAMAREVM